MHIHKRININVIIYICKELYLYTSIHIIYIHIKNYTNIEYLVALFYVTLQCSLYSARSACVHVANIKQCIGTQRHSAAVQFSCIDFIIIFLVAQILYMLMYT